MTTRIQSLAPYLLALSAAPLLGGCQGAIIGNLVVLGITVGIFFGTLGLGRAQTTATRTDASETNPGTSPSPSRRA